MDNDSKDNIRVDNDSDSKGDVRVNNGSKDNVRVDNDSNNVRVDNDSDAEWIVTG